jgi:porin
VSGISDGDPNPVRWNVRVGLGGFGLVPWTWAGYLRRRLFSHWALRLLEETTLGSSSAPGLAQRDEQGVELYYNAALTPWCHLTADLEVVQPSTKRFDTAVIAGTRLKIDF